MFYISRRLDNIHYVVTDTKDGVSEGYTTDEIISFVVDECIHIHGVYYFNNKWIFCVEQPFKPNTKMILFNPYIEVETKGNNCGIKITEWFDYYTKYVIIPYGVTDIIYDCFKNNCCLETVVMPDTLKTIGGGVFDSCVNLERVGFSESLHSLYQRTFLNCVSLKKVDLRRTKIDWISVGVFTNCSLLEELYVNSECKSIDKDSLLNLSSLRVLHVPKGCKIANRGNETAKSKVKRY